MRYIVVFIAFVLYFTANLYAAVYDVFSNANNIHYSSLNNITNSFVLNNSTKSENSLSESEISLLFDNPYSDRSIYYGISYSADIKYITGTNGSKAIFFPNIKSYVKIENYDNSLYNSMSSFTIEFYLNPYSSRMNSQVLSKMAIYNDSGITKYSGIKANIINGRLVWQLNNMFSYNGEYTNITLSKGEYLKENEWRHHSISFDASTGKLVKYIDGLEEEVVYLTSTGDRNGSPYIIEFDNIILDPLYLGQGFVGGMDSFYFVPNYKQNYNLYKYSLDGEVISKVIDFQDNNTFIDAINCTGKFTNGSYIDMYYRISNYYFSEDDDSIAWQLLESTNNIVASSSTRYIQIRAVLRSNTERDISPVLNNINIVYHKGKLPQVPINLTATASGNNSVILRWDGSHEKVTGYKIYYGTQSGIYNSAEYTPIIVNDQTEYVIDGLNGGEVYYFRITAIGGEGGNVESGFSKEVYVRPVY